MTSMPGPLPAAQVVTLINEAYAAFNARDIDAIADRARLATLRAALGS